MIIQNTAPVTQALQPDLRTHGAVPAKPISEPAVNLPRQVSPEDLKHAVTTINQALRQANRNLEFSVDADTHKTVVRMVDTSTGELIRQFPSETTLAISRDIAQLQQGLLLKQKA